MDINYIINYVDKYGILPAVPNREILNRLPLETWFKIIKRTPRWWVLRGPFGDGYKEEYRESIILFLLENPNIADIYFTKVEFHIYKACEKVIENLSSDPRILALRMSLI